MHEYTKKIIDGVEWGIYHNDYKSRELIFIDDADAQFNIDKYLEEEQNLEL